MFDWKFCVLYIAIGMIQVIIQTHVYSSCLLNYVIIGGHFTLHCPDGLSSDVEIQSEPRQQRHSVADKSGRFDRDLLVIHHVHSHIKLLWYYFSGFRRTF